MTVAGIWALKFPVLPELYVQLLRLAQERREQLPISFTDAQQATVTSDEMRHALFSKDQWGAFADRRLVQLKLLVEGEGPSPLQVVGHQDGSWAVLVNDNITDWAAVETVVDYVDRMMKLIDPSAALPALNTRPGGSSWNWLGATITVPFSWGHGQQWQASWPPCQSRPSSRRVRHWSDSWSASRPPSERSRRST
jgi:hypothetical protein